MIGTWGTYDISFHTCLLTKCFIFITLLFNTGLSRVYDSLDWVMFLTTGSLCVLPSMVYM